MQSKPQDEVKTISGESPGLHPWSEKVSLLRQKRNWPILAVLVALFLGVIIWLLTAKKQQPEEEEAVIVSVKVAKAERDSIVSEVTALGTIFPRHEATVSSKIAGQIKQMALLKNKSVNEGDVVATLEARDIQSQRAEAAAAVEEARVNLRSTTAGSIPQTQAQDEKAVRDARANVNNARALHERRVALYDQGGISKKDVEAAQLALTTAENDLRLAEATARLHAATISPNERAASEAKLKQAEDRLKALDTQLSYATIRAPFSGVITDQFQFQGEFASPGGKLFTIGDVSDVIVKAPIADTVAAQLNVGESAKVLPQDLPGEELVGTISLISRASDPQNRTVEIWVNLKNEDAKLRANTAAKVIVSTQSATNVIIVPASAVTLDTTTSNEGTVMVVDDKSIANERKVTVGIRTKDKMEITSGLKDGETVVIEGNYALPDNTRVEVSEEEENKNGDKEEKKDTKKGDEK
ncbi:MAG TPA: efflux RND transporter periplasmic adaptor subunit [Blastocatellia bacterium]|nr:efflux RND transporter periplasmic adaptor subunit [Blastocatellia bacterium]